ncbi:hypothetical protein DFH09DRAFT_1148047 [Mycena vulgaris]|nr:hypothetical protein DFH09DRAFT_1148047 [Mycena vulgaris]
MRSIDALHFIHFMWALSGQLRIDPHSPPSESTAVVLGWLLRLQYQRSVSGPQWHYPDRWSAGPTRLSPRNHPGMTQWRCTKIYKAQHQHLCKLSCPCPWRSTLLPLFAILPSRHRAPARLERTSLLPLLALRRPSSTHPAVCHFPWQFGVRPMILGREDKDVLARPDTRPSRVELRTANSRPRPSPDPRAAYLSMLVSSSARARLLLVPYARLSRKSSASPPSSPICGGRPLPSQAKLCH